MKLLSFFIEHGKLSIVHSALRRSPKYILRTKCSMFNEKFSMINEMGIYPLKKWSFSHSSLNMEN